MKINWKIREARATLFLIGLVILNLIMGSFLYFSHNHKVPLRSLAEGKGLTEKDREYLWSIGDNAYNDVLKRLPKEIAEQLHALINNPEFNDDQREGKVTGVLSRLKSSEFGLRANAEDQRIEDFKFWIRWVFLIGVPTGLRALLKPETWRRWRWIIFAPAILGLCYYGLLLFAATKISI